MFLSAAGFSFSLFLSLAFSFLLSGRGNLSRGRLLERVNEEQPTSATTDKKRRQTTYTHEHPVLCCFFFHIFLHRFEFLILYHTYTLIHICKIKRHNKKVKKKRTRSDRSIIINTATTSSPSSRIKTKREKREL